MRPALPNSFYEIDLRLAARSIFWASLLWLGPMLAIGWILQSQMLGIVASIIVIPLLSALGGFGMLLAAYVGHEGMHFTLHKSKLISAVLGIIVTAPIVVLVQIGFGLSHWEHHQFLGTAKDPDERVFGRYRNLISRALFARSHVNRVYLKNAVRFLFEGKSHFVFPLPQRKIRNLVIFNLVLNSVFLLGHISLIFIAPSYALGFLAVLIAANLISGLNPYREHAGTNLEDGYDSRTVTGRFWDVLLLGNNYHLEHHLYPMVPSYRLKQVHNYLLSQGFYDCGRRHNVQGSWQEIFRFAHAQHKYGRTQE